MKLSNLNESIQQERSQKYRSYNERIKNEIYKMFLSDFNKWWFSKIEKYKIIWLKKTWKIVKRKNWENSYTTVSELENWDYRFKIEQYGNIITFEWRDINDLQSQYNNWYDKVLGYKEFVAPDGTIWTYAFFVKEFTKWFFHGCSIIKKTKKQKK